MINIYPRRPVLEKKLYFKFAVQHLHARILKHALIIWTYTSVEWKA